MRLLRLVNLEYLVCLGPVILIAGIFIITPLGVILFFSFLSKGIFGQLIYSFSLDAYHTLFSGTLFIEVLLRSYLLALVTTLFCILIGYPVAYWLSMYRRGKIKMVLLALIVLPTWTSYLIRLYSWTTITMNTGIINTFISKFGLGPIQIMYTPYAILLGLTYTWLPFMILPLYAAIDGIDRSILESALDLGANPVERFFKITLPLTRGGLFAGVLLVFVPSLGSYLVPDLLGGAKVNMIGNLVADKFLKLANIPLGSATALLLSLLVILLLMIYIKTQGKGALERLT